MAPGVDVVDPHQSSRILKRIGTRTTSPGRPLARSFSGKVMALAIFSAASPKC